MSCGYVATVLRSYVATDSKCVLEWQGKEVCVVFVILLVWRSVVPFLSFT